MKKHTKPRWRTTKQAKHHTTTKAQKIRKMPFFLWERIIAFITDMFMINMPILYIAYFILGSKEAFLGNQSVIFVCVVSFGIILSLFIAANGQTPGYRYVGLQLVAQDEQNQKVSFVVAFLRYVLWIISMASIIGMCIAYFRQDRKTFYDLVCHTQIIQKPTAKPTESTKE